MATLSISAAEFKAKCLQLMNEVDAKHQEYVITKHGKPIAKLVPTTLERPYQATRGCMKSTVTIQGNVILPLDEIWNADV
jgi:prevent-host-death family protein